jgi:hypothetical protein
MPARRPITIPCVMSAVWLSMAPFGRPENAAV